MVRKAWSVLPGLFLVFSNCSRYLNNENFSFKGYFDIHPNLITQNT